MIKISWDIFLLTFSITFFTMNPYIISFRVYYEDTDAAGVVYHANYLKFAERARTEWLRGLGIDQSILIKEQGLFIPVFKLSIRYLLPAMLDDLIFVETKLIEISHVCMHLVQSIRRDNILLATLDVHIACINRKNIPSRWPIELKQKLRKILV